MISPVPHRLAFHVAVCAVVAVLLPSMATAQYLPPGSVDFYSSQVGVKLGDPEVKISQVVAATVITPEKLAAPPGTEAVPPLERGEKVKGVYTADNFLQKRP